MKKLICKWSLVFFVSFSCMNAKAQALEQGNSVIDIYYGFPNLYTAILKTTVTNSGTEQQITVKGLGPLGGRYEYMVSEKIGLGAEVNYANSSIKWLEPDGNGHTYTYQLDAPRIRIMGRFNIHFGSSEKFDGYFGVGAGYNSTTYKYTSTDPDFTGVDVKNLIPVAFRLAVGGRYFFTENLGASFELGLGGGGIIHLGLACKI